MSSYGRAVGGGLNLKGEPQVAKKKKRRRRKEGGDGGGGEDGGEREGGVAAREERIEVNDGTGKIVTSGTSVMGVGTSFKAELKRDDVLLAVCGEDETIEGRAVLMVLDNAAAGIDQPFTDDLSKPTTFTIQRTIKAPPSEAEQRAAKRAHKQSLAPPQTIQFREKQEGGHGLYTTRTAVLGKGATREDALLLRQQRKADRYCK